MLKSLYNGGSGGDSAGGSSGLGAGYTDDFTPYFMNLFEGVEKNHKNSPN
jgi:hypothetical protein